MVYPFSFHRIVLAGDLYSERWANTLSVSDGGASPAVDSTLLTSLASAVATWFTSTGTNGPSFSNYVKLTELKVNRINAAGRYEDAVSMTHVYPTPPTGPGVQLAAPQLAAAVSLRTAFDRGLANRGRIYLPPSAGWTVPGSDGRVTAADALNKANAVATLINSINSVYAAWAGGGDFGGRVSIMSDRGLGAWHLVTKTECGRVIDTMRSRRSSLDEDHQTNTTAIAGA